MKTRNRLERDLRAYKISRWPTAQVMKDFITTSGGEEKVKNKVPQGILYVEQRIFASFLEELGWAPYGGWLHSAVDYKDENKLMFFGLQVVPFYSSRRQENSHPHANYLILPFTDKTSISL